MGGFKCINQLQDCMMLFSSVIFVEESIAEIPNFALHTVDGEKIWLTTWDVWNPIK